MEYVAIIISLIALVGAGFAFIRANSSHHILSKRIEALKDHNKLLVERLGRMEGKGNRQQPEKEEGGRRNQQREQQAEARVTPPRAEQQEQRQKQQRNEQQQRPEQQQRAEQRNEQRNEQQLEQRQRQRDRQQRQPQPQQPTALEPQQPEQESQPQRRRKENRRRNEPSERQSLEETGREARPGRPVKLEFAEGDLLDELEQAAGNPAAIAAPVDTPYTGKKFAIIPEDGVIRLHQLQQQADSDSYIEVDHPAEGSNMTHYRFNLAGNHAFVIAQGIDRLENAFDFEKPSNRMVTKVVQQQDGVLTKVNNGWKIMEKARIDFR